MTTINHEAYCGQDLINLLLKAGFDWQDYFVAHDINEHFHWEIPLHIAQKWLREVKRINVEVMYLFEPYNHYFARACYLDTNTPLYIPNPPASTIYEEAQEAGIKKALEIILEK